MHFFFFYTYIFFNVKLNFFIFFFNVYSTKLHLKYFDFILKKKKKKKFYFNFFFEYFFKCYLEAKIKQNMFLNLNNLNKKKINFFFYKKWFKLFKKNFNFYKLNFYFFKKSIYLFLMSLVFCDAVLILDWFKTNIEQFNIKKHKTITKWFMSVLTFFLIQYEYILKIKGLYARINGKIGLSGASKKKSLILKKKNFSLNNFLNKINYSKTQIKTKSGTLGIIFFLVF